MGQLFYSGSTIAVIVEDRVLAHLQVVVNAKLKRNSSFMLTLRDTSQYSDSSAAMWISRGIPLYFSFDSARGVEISEQWVRQLLLAADSTGGLHLGAEPPSD